MFIYHYPFDDHFANIFADWGWTYIGLSINHCGTGLDMSKGGPNAQAVGSVIIVDSSIANTTTGILTAYVFQNKFNATDLTGGSLALENVNITQVGTAVQGVNGASLVGTNSSSPSFTIDAWVEGNTYNPTGPNDAMGDATAFTRPQTLQGNSSSYFTWSKPQYEHLNASAFLSARTAGCKGDGVTDDTAAITAAIALAQSNGKILFFDAGIYVVTSTIVFTPGLKVIGESYPVILGSGSSFSDVSNPLPVVQVGNSNATQGIVQWSDMVVSTQGNTAGAILIQWNLLSDSNSPSGMWDIHTRIGGFKGSKLQADDCPISPANPDCAAAFASMQITTSAGGLYMENIWLWTADHDLDDPSQSSVTVLTGRGLSVEAEAGNIWL
jgi:glucan 1,3-beta-glucosidase